VQHNDVSSSSVQQGPWSGRWDQQHDDVVLMVESICEQGFAYGREVEEDRSKDLSNWGKKERQETAARRLQLNKISVAARLVSSFL
jgi:hypothetical protein